MKKIRKILLATVAFTLLNTCDDGDITTIELDFDDSFTACTANNLVFYKIKENPAESLSVLISNLTLSEILTVDEETNTYEDSFNLSSTNVFNYRTYHNTELPDDLFCSDIPPSEVNIANDYPSTSGTVTIKTIRFQDDADGIPAELEGQDPNGDGDFSDAQDTDNDGIPDYLDTDDDGDNVPTSKENPDPNGDGVLDDAQDTDGDGIPDYLDTDDDDDGVLTRDEESQEQDQNPTNDISDVIADYLNPNVTESVPAVAYAENTITNTFVTTLIVTSFDIEIISFESFSFGAMDTGIIPSSFTKTTTTPDFD
ncbi:MAG: hypothetical protein ACK5MZ_11490 [Aestuariibaculum sp.]